VAYNLPVKWREWTWIAGPTIGIVGWIAAPIIKAKIDGTSPGIFPSLKNAIAAPLPAWETFLLVCAAVAVTFVALRQRKKKANLSIIVLPSFKPMWSIGAQATTPFMSFHFQARMATTEDHSLEIVKVYLKGMTPVVLFSQIVVAGRYDPPCMVHFAARPILANPGKEFTGRVVLIDQYGDQHITERITFCDNPHPPETFGFREGATVNCLICRKEISIEDLHPSASIPAHRQCVK
jgi:hypothetical protein